MQQQEYEHEVNRLCAAWKQRLLTELAKVEKPYPNVFHHYVDFKTCIEILESNVVWATDGLYMRDGMELRWSATLMNEWLERSILSPKGASAKTVSFVQQIIQILKAQTEPKSRYTLTFITSFSAAEDSLSHWREYGGKLTGVALGFDLSWYRTENASFSSALSLNACIYDESIQRNIVEDLLGTVLEFAIANYDDSYDARVEKMVCLAMIIASSTLGVILKHPKYVDEREWRLARMGNRERDLPAAELRRTGYGSAPFEKLALGTDGKLPLSTVTLGPLMDFARQQEVEEVLRRNGYNVPVIRSNIPERC